MDKEQFSDKIYDFFRLCCTEDLCNIKANDSQILIDQWVDENYYPVE